MEPDTDTRRISLVIREDQHRRMAESNVNVSGLIRDLIDDHYSTHAITMHVSEETHALYSRVVSEAPQGDVDLEPYLRKALHDMLGDKIRKMEELQKSLKKK